MKWIVLLFLSPLSGFAQQYDILITNGKIIDGTGNSWYYGNVAVKESKILQLGRDGKLPAKKTIDAKGLIASAKSLL